MTPFDPRLPIIAAEAKVKTCHVFHCAMAMREMGRKFHREAFAQFAGLEPRHVDRIITALEAHDALPDKRSATTARGTRLPDDWTLPQEWAEWATQERGWAPKDVEAEAAGFADYWQSVTGRNASKLDWRKTWQNWCRNSRRPQGDYKPVTGQRKTPAEWLAYCEERLQWAKERNFRPGILEWQDKVNEARIRVADNVLPFGRVG